MNLRASLTLATLALGSIFALQGCLGSTEDDTDVPENVNPSRADAYSMPSCGTVLASFDGTDAHSNAGDTGSGYSCAGSGAYGYQYQCVELVMRHFKTHWGLSWYGNAKDLLANAPASTVEVRWNGDGAHPPVPGDMIVWTNSTYGHVALVTAVHASGIDIIEQNVSGNGSATLPWDGAHIGARWTTWVPAGWAHAKANGSSSSGSGGSGGSGGGGTGGSGGSGGAGGAGGSGGSGGSTSATTTAATTSSTTTSGGGGVNWSCANSAYNGHQYWTCSGGNLYECQSGVPVEQACPGGCHGNGLGKDDTCIQQNVSWSCANSAYAGNQYWTCSGGSIYKCANGVTEEVVCPNGCNVMALGTDDTCK